MTFWMRRPLSRALSQLRIYNGSEHCASRRSLPSLPYASAIISRAQASTTTSLHEQSVKSLHPHSNSKKSHRRTNPVPICKSTTDAQQASKLVTAYCASEEYNIPAAAKIISSQGISIDPRATHLYPQVLHFRTAGADEDGEVFIFPSGTVVAWAADPSYIRQLICETLLPASINAHTENIETENFEFELNASTSKSSVAGDRIVLSPASETNATLTKIAFSSGISRSVKLAVLESALEFYFETTRLIPTLLSKGKSLRYSRGFIMRKTGELFSMRAQLNLYSELTDSLPDLFWDSKSELGLEENFEQIVRALDVGVRIRTLNRRLDYAGEVNAVLRERASERHGLIVEWLIIALISIEIALELHRIWREKRTND